MSYIKRYVLSALLIATSLLGTRRALAAPPSIAPNFAFQGVVTNLADGNYTMEITLHNAAGTTFQTTLNNVATVNGVFSLIITPSNVDQNTLHPLNIGTFYSQNGVPNIYATVAISDAAGNAIGTFDQLALTAVGDAFVAQTALSLQGVTVDLTDNSDGAVLQFAGGKLVSGASVLSASSATSFSGNLGGDVTGTQTDTQISKLQGTPISVNSPATGSILSFNGTSWVPATPAAGTSYTGGNGVTITGGSVIGLDTSFYNGTTLSASVLPGTVVQTSGGFIPATLLNSTSFGTGVINGSSLANNTIGSTQIANGAIGNAQIANGAVDLTSQVSNVLPYTNGGTGSGAAAFTSGQLVVAGASGLASPNGSGANALTWNSASHSLGVGVSAPGSTLDVAGNVNAAGLSLLNQGVIKLGDTLTNTIAIRAPASLGAPSTIWTLPANAGTNGQILSTDNSGNLSWINAGGAGNVTGPGSSITNNIPLFSSSTGQALADSGVSLTTLLGVTAVPTKVSQAGDTMTGALTVLSSARANALVIANQASPGTLKFGDSGGNSLALRSPTALNTSVMLTFPSAVPTAGAYLQSTDTAGNLAWTNINNASTSTNGLLTSTDWNTFNNASSGGTAANKVTKSGDSMSGNLNIGANVNAIGLTSVSANINSLTATGISASGITLVGSMTVNGINPSQLVSTDGAKNLISTPLGNLASGTPSVTVAGTGSVVGSGLTVSIATATAASSGLLTNSDWVSFNANSSGKVSKTGDTMTGNLQTPSHTVTGVMTSSVISAVTGNVSMGLYANVLMVGSSTTVQGAFNAANITIPNQGSQGTLTLSDAGSSYLRLRAPTSVSAPYMLSFPINPPSAGAVLQSDGSGNLSWSTMIGVGTGAGAGNTIVGITSGLNITSGTENTILGFQAGYAETTGGNNTFIGAGSAPQATTGTNNTFVGAQTGSSVTTLSNNTLVGFNASAGTSANFQASAFGSGATASGNNAVAVGYSATASGLDSGAFGYNAVASGGDAMAFGESAKAAGTDSSSFGVSAGQNSSATANYDTFMGASAGYNNTTGTYNSFLGYSSGYGTTTGTDNVFMGASSGTSNTTGSNNTFMGFQAGVAISSANNNVVIGADAGSITSIYSGQNVIVGASANIASSSSNAVNSVALGFGAIVTTGSAVQLGTGTNSKPNSLQFNNFNFLNDQGMANFVATVVKTNAASSVNCTSTPLDMGTGAIQTVSSGTLISSCTVPLNNVQPGGQYMVVFASSTISSAGTMSFTQGTNTSCATFKYNPSAAFSAGYDAVFEIIDVGATCYVRSLSF